MARRGLVGAKSLALIALFAQTGCSSHYQPRSPTRLSVVIDSGNLAYQRDGKTFSHGAFGGGLADAVEDDQEAREAAETYHEHMVGGLIAYVASTVCLVGGLTWALSAGDLNDQDGKLNSEQTAIAIGALGCWAAGLVTGTVLVAVGQPYQWDAINIYNDNREARGRRSLPPLPPAPAGIPPVGRGQGAEGPRGRGQSGREGQPSPATDPPASAPSAPASPSLGPSAP